MTTSTALGYFQVLRRYFGWYTGGFIVFVLLLAVAEQLGLPHVWIGYTFMAFTILIYATIGIISRTADIVEYYVAGRRIPAIFNGMATGSDWMSAASFIGMAGALYFSGFDGLAYVMGWTGGYVLVGLYLAPYLRKFGQFTIPDFLGTRYEGNFVRVVGAVTVVLVSFVYVVAQIYGVGLISSRFLGVDLSTGVFAGLVGILVCSFLGGMRAVTWTQVAQYVVLIIAYVVPVVMLSIHITGAPIPQIAYGQALREVTQQEQKIFNDPKQQQVLQHYAQRAKEIETRIQRLPASLTEERQRLKDNPQLLQELPESPEEAREVWGRDLATAKAKAQSPISHAAPFKGEVGEKRDASRNNFLALVFCLMVGTAALPHILIRYYTTPSVREARASVFWSVVAIFLLYVTAPALAVLAKHAVYFTLVGAPIADLPAWITAWSKVGLVRIEDINSDGLLQLAELTLDPDIIVLAAPEMAGLPYVISGLVAAGGLAAALSTADGLLLTIANALAHDIYFKIISPAASTSKRVAISKGMLVLVAVSAAYVATFKPGHILSIVAWAFSIAASGFFPALVLGIFWKRANKWGAVAGMTTGITACLFYLISVRFFDMTPWFGIKDIASGVFGVPIGFITIILVSLVTPSPSREIYDLVDRVRYPNLKGE
ncbi:MAG: cation acetate symporter [Magnetococcales bacterium]|nr:VC_2705 family sodium/solute symporter [Magnetococcales bacterium]NGZ26046.1 cation acetate symporter [Magnetococcales bacterium]